MATGSLSHALVQSSIKENLISYKCSVCNPLGKDVTNRFCVKVEVEDLSGAAIFVLYDHDASYLFKQSCDDLLHETGSRMESLSLPEYPSVFQTIVGRNVLFKVHSKDLDLHEFFGSFKVHCVCDDVMIISQFQARVSKSPDLEASVDNGAIPSPPAIGEPAGFADFEPAVVSQEDDSNDDVLDFLYHANDILTDGVWYSQDGFYVMAGVINSVAHEMWWHLTCVCGCAVYKDMDSYFCSACGSHVEITIPRYRVKLGVDYQCGDAVFILFDREMRQLVDKTCAELLEDAKESSSIDDVRYPSCFDSLIGKKMLFVIDVGNLGFEMYNGGIAVDRICYDPSIMRMFNLAESIPINYQVDILTAVQPANDGAATQESEDPYASPINHVEITEIRLTPTFMKMLNVPIACQIMGLFLKILNMMCPLMHPTVVILPQSPMLVGSRSNETCKMNLHGPFKLID